MCYSVKKSVLDIDIFKVKMYHASGCSLKVVFNDNLWDGKSTKLWLQNWWSLLKYQLIKTTFKQPLYVYKNIIYTILQYNFEYWCSQFDLKGLKYINKRVIFKTRVIEELNVLSESYKSRSTLYSADEYFSFSSIFICWP